MIDEKKLTIDEAIAHAREVAERNRKQYKNCPDDRRDIAHQTCRECYKEHEQLAKWLEELKQYRAIGTVEQFRKSVKNKWIPCSEALPPKPEENRAFDKKPVYLVSVNGEDYPHRALWNGRCFTDGFLILEAVAWMPLPEPYKGE